MSYLIWQNLKESGDAFIYGGWPHSVGMSFMTGDPLDRPVPEIRITMNDRSQGRITDNVLMTGQGRVFSDRLLGLLGECGVDNIEAYPCIIENQVTGETHANFFAVNIVGKIACADRAASSFTDFGDGSNKILAWDYLTLDEGAIRDKKLFVLAEMPVQIVVQRDVANVLEMNGVTGVEFVQQGDRSFKPNQDDLSW